jgi:glycerol-3-phosphate dehydrogenase
LTIGGTEFVIIDGNISGMDATYELACIGAKVTLLERGSLASMAPSWNAQ